MANGTCNYWPAFFDVHVNDMWLCVNTDSFTTLSMMMMMMMIMIMMMIINNKILRILQNAPRETHVVDLYITFNTLTLPNLHKFHILLFMHKFVHHNELLPNIFSSHFTKKSDLHTYNTRSKNEPHFQLLPIDKTH